MTDLAGTSRARPPWQTSSALVFVGDPDAPVLSPEDAHHLSRVLRLRAGEVVCVGDGDGRWRLATFNGRDSLEPTGREGREQRPEPSLTVGLALVKGDKPDLVVQKLTEIGIDRIAFFEAARSVVRWNQPKIERNVERLARVARSACAQSRRLWFPDVEFIELDDLVARGAVVTDLGGRRLERSDTVVLVGPEGGWAEGECDGAVKIDLGPNVLRAETAAIAVAVQMVSERHGHPE